MADTHYGGLAAQILMNVADANPLDPDAFKRTVDRQRMAARDLARQLPQGNGVEGAIGALIDKEVVTHIMMFRATHGLDGPASLGTLAALTKNVRGELAATTVNNYVVSELADFMRVNEVSNTDFRSITEFLSYPGDSRVKLELDLALNRSGRLPSQSPPDRRQVIRHSDDASSIGEPFPGDLSTTADPAPTNQAPTRGRPGPPVTGPSLF